MNEYFFTFRSVTAAMRAAKLLTAAGIRSATVRTPNELRQQGCGYSLRVPERVYRETLQTLLRENAGFRKLYRRLPDGRWEEVTV